MEEDLQDAIDIAGLLGADARHILFRQWKREALDAARRERSGNADKPNVAAGDDATKSGGAALNQPLRKAAAAGTG